MTATAHSLEAEQSVLGAILLAPSKALGPVREVLRPLDFFSHQHRRIYEAVLALAADNKPVDVLTISEFLGSMLEACGGLEKLAELAGKVPTAENVGYHARIVADKALTRELRAELARVQASEAEGEELLVEAHQALGMIHPRRRSSGQTLRSLVIPTINRIEKGDKAFIGMTTGIASLDKALIFGVQRLVEVVLAGRPGMGKSSLSAQIARNAADIGGTVDYYSLEDGKESLTMRLLAQLAQVDNGRLRAGDLKPVEWGYVSQAAGRLHALGDRFQIFDNTDIDPHDAERLCLQIRQRAMERREKTPAEKWRHLIVVDYIQLLWLRGFKDRRDLEVQKINGLLKAIPAACDCHLIVCSQLKRSDEDRSPKLSDLRESGAIEQDAHQVVMLDRPEWLCDADGKAIDSCWAHVRKNKDGKPGTVPLSWRGEYVLFGDADEETKRMSWAALKAQNKRGKR